MCWIMCDHGSVGPCVIMDLLDHVWVRVKVRVLGSYVIMSVVDHVCHL